MPNAPTTSTTSPHPQSTKPSNTRQCYYCKGFWDAGEPTGDLMIVWPLAEVRWWGHCLTERHQIVMRFLAENQSRHLRDIPVTLARAKAGQKDQQNPVMQGLKRLLG